MFYDVFFVVVSWLIVVVVVYDVFVTTLDAIDYVVIYVFINTR